MKILIVTEFFPEYGNPVFTGGVESRTFHLSSYLTRRSHQVSILKRGSCYGFNSLTTLFSRLFFFLRLIVGCIFFTRRFDIVEGTNFVTYILAFLYAKRTGARAIAWYPDVFVGHGMERLGLVSGIATEIAERLAVRLPWDGIIALSEETKNKLIENGVDEKKIEVIYGGTEKERYQKYQKYQKYQRPTIICVARLVKYKRVQDLLLAIYFLRERFDDIRLIIIGNGPELSKLQATADRLQITDKVRFLRSVSETEKWELLARSHIHVLPSVVEGFGLVTIEALSVGTPVVNADIPINREILSGSKVSRLTGWQVKGGLLFDSGEVVDLAEKIEMLLSDSKLYNQKVSEGKELAKRYAWEKANQQTENFYQRLLSD